MSNNPKKDATYEDDAYAKRLPLKFSDYADYEESIIDAAKLHFKEAGIDEEVSTANCFIDDRYIRPTIRVVCKTTDISYWFDLKSLMPEIAL